VVTHIFYNCFYHFYHEVVAKIYLLQNMLSGKARILMPDTLYPFHHAIIDLLSLRRHILFIPNNVVVKADAVVTCSFPAESSNYHPEILWGFRRWLFERVGFVDAVPGVRRKIFVGRRAARRNIVNLDEVRELCRSFGYTYVEMEDLEFRQQIGVFAHATHIVAIHGAALSHLIFAPLTCRVVELMHDNFNVHFYQKMCATLGIRYSMLRCKIHGSPAIKTEDRHLDMLVDINRLGRALADQMDDR
jgi:capsular polysaccharide biosynthesis protein